MGCDIHGWVEVFDNNKWIACTPLKDDSRNYQRFALLAGVRDYDNINKAQPLGIPKDVSETTLYHINQWDVDGHSHSYLPILEAANIFLETQYNASDFAKEYPVCHFFDIGSDGDMRNYRLVFWFDN
jgi:hypothetical protein